MPGSHVAVKNPASTIGLYMNPAETKHYENSIFIPASAQDVFDYVDDHSNYYSHVIKFARLVGGRMDLQFDEGHGQSVGSHIHLSGKVFGKLLSLEEVITRREPPQIKTWETVGTPKFLIVGQYRYNVQIEPQGRGCLLRVSFDYDPPKGSGWLRRLFSGVYAKLCAREMTTVTRDYFTKHSQILDEVG